MKYNDPFEKQWQDKLKAGLTKIGKADLFNDIIEHIQTDDRVEWNRQLMTLLSANLSEAEIKLVMCSCACLAPKDNLAHIRDEYVKTKIFLMSMPCCSNNLRYSSVSIRNWMITR